MFRQGDEEMNPPWLDFRNELWKRHGGKDCRGSLLSATQRPSCFKRVTFPDLGRLSHLYVGTRHLVDGNSVGGLVMVKEMMMELVMEMMEIVEMVVKEMMMEMVMICRHDTECLAVWVLPCGLSLPGLVTWQWLELIHLRGLAPCPLWAPAEVTGCLTEHLTCGVWTG